MKAAVEVYEDICILKIMDDTGAVVDRYETRDIFVENYQYKRKYADPEGTLPIATTDIN
ncbi:MAG: hypothetical protein ACYDHW_12780 [Syntrophorhabdaceae bacterium]